MFSCLSTSWIESSPSGVVISGILGMAVGRSGSSGESGSISAIDGIRTARWDNTRVMSVPAYLILSLQLGGWDNNNAGAQDNNTAPFSPAHVVGTNEIFHPTAFDLTFTFTPPGGEPQSFVDTLSRSPARKKAYDCVSCLNRHHPKWAWMSLIWVGWTDVYIRLCSMGVFRDWRIF